MKVVGESGLARLESIRPVRVNKVGKSERTRGEGARKGEGEGR